jgi:hypothetical protein
LALFDLNAGPVTITMPDAGKRFMVLMVANEDHYVRRFSTVRGRTPKGTNRHALRHGRGPYARQSGRPEKRAAGPRASGRAEPEKHWHARSATLGRGSQKKVWDALLVLNTTISNFKDGFGAKGKVDPIMHLIGTASAGAAIPTRTRPI